MENIPIVKISFDFEIAWGDVTNRIWEQREKQGTYLNLRPALLELLTAMKSYEIPATWATVGAMIDSPDKREFDYVPDTARKHIDRLTIKGNQSSHDGRDLFEMVLSDLIVGHRIGCHSYSHIPFDFDGVDARFVEYDLAQANRAFKNYDLSPEEFVFPENTEGFHDILCSAGIKTARIKADVDMSNRAKYLITTLVKSPPLSTTKQLSNGLLLESGSMLFNMGVNKAYRMPFVYARACRGLSELVSYEGHTSNSFTPTMHIWAHPFNFAEGKILRNTFIRFLKKLAIQRDKGLVRIEVM